MQHGSIQLQQWQQRQGLDQRPAALRLGVHYASYCKMRNGTRLPGRALALKIQTITGIPVGAWVPLKVAKAKKTAPSLGKSAQCFQGGNAHAR